MGPWPHQKLEKCLSYPQTWMFFYVWITKRPLLNLLANLTTSKFQLPKGRNTNNNYNYGHKLAELKPHNNYHYLSLYSSLYTINLNMTNFLSLLNYESILFFLQVYEWTCHLSISLKHLIVCY